MPYENHECGLMPGAVSIMRRTGKPGWRMFVFNLGDPVRLEGADFEVSVRFEVRACPFCGALLEDAGEGE